MDQDLSRHGNEPPFLPSFPHLPLAEKKKKKGQKLKNGYDDFIH